MEAAKNLKTPIQLTHPESDRPSQSSDLVGGDLMFSQEAATVRLHHSVLNISVNTGNRQLSVLLLASSVIFSAT